MNALNPGARSTRTRDEAAYWYVALQSPNPSPQMLKRWQKWISVPANKQAFDEAEQFWELLGDARKPGWPTDAEVDADTYDGSVPIAVFEQKRRTAGQARYRFSSSWFGLAAVVSTVAIGLGILFAVLEFTDHRSTGMTVFETDAGQHESVVLDDGSKIYMGARSSVTSNISRDVRLIVMDRGEAQFKVAHDPKRPFRVLAGGGIITAVGTEFNVRRLDGLVMVTVTEGTVEVAPASAVTAKDGGDFPHGTRVAYGEAISYDAQGKVGEVRKVDLEVAMAWREGRLEYTSEPLSYVVQDINRYSRRLIAIADAEAGEALYSGTVFERDIDDWIDALDEAMPEVTVVEPDSRHVVIRSRAE